MCLFFQAYKKWVAEHGEERTLPGLDLTHDQLFFLNYAQIWCGSMRPEDALTKIRSSVHSPGPIRVLGPLSNSRYANIIFYQKEKSVAININYNKFTFNVNDSIISSSRDFSNAYNCPVNSRMNPTSKCSVWQTSKPILIPGITLHGGNW